MFRLLTTVATLTTPLDVAEVRRIAPTITTTTRSAGPTFLAIQGGSLSASTPTASQQQRQKQQQYDRDHLRDLPFIMHMPFPYMIWI